MSFQHYTGEAFMKEAKRKIFKMAHIHRAGIEDEFEVGKK